MDEREMRAFGYRRWDFAAPCPICSLAGGFHDTVVHGGHEVSRTLVKVKDWHKT